MSYPKEIYNQAFRILEQRRVHARQTQEDHQEEVYRRLPRVAQIDRQLAQTGIAVVRKVLDAQNIDEEIQVLKEENLALQQERAHLLQQAGYPANYLQPAYHCTKCQDRGYVGNVMCTCLSDLLKQQAYQLLNANIPLEDYGFERFRLDYYDNTPVDETQVVPRTRMATIFQRCQDYARRFHPGAESLLLLGGTGLGKTHLSLSIAAAVIEKGYGVIYASTPNLINKLEREHFGPASPEEDRSYLNMVCQCDLLVLDDLGAEFATQFSASTLYHIINQRLVERRPTIINTNLTPAELEQRYQERIVSRILCSYVVFQFVGRDIRLLKRTQRF